MHQSETLPNIIGNIINSKSKTALTAEPARNEHNNHIQKRDYRKHDGHRQQHLLYRSPISVPLIFKSGARLVRGLIALRFTAYAADRGHIGYGRIIVVPDDFFFLFLVPFVRHISPADTNGKLQNARVRILYSTELYVCISP